MMNDFKNQWTSFGVKAYAHWAGSRCLLPVTGEAWFLLSTLVLNSKQITLPDLMNKARLTYPTMHEVVERYSMDKELPCLGLRHLEVYEDDVSHSGLGQIRVALEKRAQVCGMRVVACLNACAGLTVAHGMPLDKHPSLIEDSTKLTMIEELELTMMTLIKENMTQKDTSSRL